MQIASEHMKCCLTSLVIREMQPQTTVRYYSTARRMAIMRESDKTVFARMCKNQNLHTCPCGGLSHSEEDTAEWWSIACEIRPQDTLWLSPCHLLGHSLWAEPTAMLQGHSMSP